MTSSSRPSGIFFGAVFGPPPPLPAPPPPPRQCPGRPISCLRGRYSGCRHRHQVCHRRPWESCLPGACRHRRPRSCLSLLRRPSRPSCQPTLLTRHVHPPPARHALERFARAPCGSSHRSHPVIHPSADWPLHDARHPSQYFRRRLAPVPLPDCLRYPLRHFPTRCSSRRRKLFESLRPGPTQTHRPLHPARRHQPDRPTGHCQRRQTAFQLHPRRRYLYSPARRLPAGRL